MKSNVSITGNKKKGYVITIKSMEHYINIDDTDLAIPIEKSIDVTAEELHQIVSIYLESILLVKDDYVTIHRGGKK